MGAENDSRPVAADVDFRGEVRAFLAANLTPELAEAPRTSLLINQEPQQVWHRILAAKGWVTPSWPPQFGGVGWTPEQHQIFEEELSAADAPPLSAFLEMIGPVLYSFGTPEQIEQHLAPLRSGDVLWCQGYSEPGAGSDLASLRTRAVKEGDDYVVNGQKIWTTYAHCADWMFALVRTSNEGKPQSGISFLLIDMKTPGVSIRPIRSIDGLHHLNEVFFEDVRVPVSNLVGAENGGWTIAKFLLEHERSGVGSLITLQSQLDRVRSVAGKSFDLTDPDQAAEHDAIDLALCDAQITLDGLDAFNQRQAALGQRDAGHPGAPSIMKLAVTELQQQIAELGVRALRSDALRDQSALVEDYQPERIVGQKDGPLLMLHYLFGRAFTILGGTSEVQRNLIARALAASATAP